MLVVLVVAGCVYVYCSINQAYCAMLLNPSNIPTAMMCPMDPAARTSTKVIPIGSPVSMSLPLSARLRPCSILELLAVPGAYPFLTANNMMAVPVHTAMFAGEPMKPSDKCEDNQSHLTIL